MHSHRISKRKIKIDSALLDGETATVFCGEVTLRRSEAEDVAGWLYITNYRLLFASPDEIDGSHGMEYEYNEDDQRPGELYSVPLLSLREVQQSEQKMEVVGHNGEQQLVGILDVWCKNVRCFQLLFMSIGRQKTRRMFTRCYGSLYKL